MYISKGVTSMSNLPMACLLCTNDEKLSNFGDKMIRQPLKCHCSIEDLKKARFYVISGLGNVISIKHAI